MVFQKKLVLHAYRITATTTHPHPMVGYTCLPSLGKNTPMFHCEYLIYFLYIPDNYWGNIFSRAAKSLGKEQVTRLQLPTNRNSLQPAMILKNNFCSLTTAKKGGEFWNFVHTLKYQGWSKGGGLERLCPYTRPYICYLNFFDWIGVPQRNNFPFCQPEASDFYCKLYRVPS